MEFAGALTPTKADPWPLLPSVSCSEQSFSDGVLIYSCLSRNHLLVFLFQMINFYKDNNGLHKQETKAQTKVVSLSGA